MTSEVHTVGFYITCIQAALLIIYCALLRFVTCGRPRSQNDGLLALSTWPHLWRAWLPFILVVIFAIPVFIFVFSNAVGGILAWFEDWTFMQGFEYVIGNMQSLPISSLSPGTSAGKIIDSFFCILSMFCGSLVMGGCAQMGVVDILNNYFASASFLNFLCLFGIIMVFILIVCFVFSIAIPVIENLDIGAALLYLISQTTGIQNPLISWLPDKHLGWFIAGYSTVVALSLQGAIVGILGQHPVVLRLIDLLEASSERDDEKEEKKQMEPANDSAVLEAQIADLECEVEKLQGALLEKTMECENLRNSGILPEDQNAIACEHGLPGDSLDKNLSVVERKLSELSRSSMLLADDNAMLNELERKVEELQGTLSEKNVECEKLRISVSQYEADKTRLAKQHELESKVDEMHADISEIAIEFPCSGVEELSFSGLDNAKLEHERNPNDRHGHLSDKTMDRTSVSQCAADNTKLHELGRKFEELQGNLVDRSFHCEELQRLVTMLKARTAKLEAENANLQQKTPNLDAAAAQGFPCVCLTRR